METRLERPARAEGRFHRDEQGRDAEFEQGIGLRTAVASLLALGGWCYVYASSGRTPIVLSLAILATGLVPFLIWARAEREWPFGPKRSHEEFMTTSPA